MEQEEEEEEGKENEDGENMVLIRTEEEVANPP